MDGPLGPLTPQQPPARRCFSSCQPLHHRQARHGAPGLVNHTAPAVSQGAMAASCQARQRLQSGRPSVSLRAWRDSGVGAQASGGQLRLA